MVTTFRSGATVPHPSVPHSDVRCSPITPGSEATQTAHSSTLQYVLEETNFSEWKLANIVVENASGPLHPSASFGFYGHLALSDNGANLTIHVNAKGARFSPEAGLNRVTWIVTASLLNDGETILKQPVIQHYRYLIAPGTIVVGEATFQLPPPEMKNSLSLFLEGTYIADFGPYSFTMFPQFPPLSGRTVYVRKSFPIRVEHAR